MDKRESKFQKHLTYILAMLVVFEIVSGGALNRATASAVSLITGKQIANHTITQDKLTPGAVKSLQGQKGEQGITGLAGAYYAKAFYYAQNVNAGAIREVACKSKLDTAISGGFQTLGINGLPSNVSSSFVGRLDWKTQKPIPGRHDGWIVQFDVKWAPQNARLWALCVPSPYYVPEVQTFFETS